MRRWMATSCAEDYADEQPDHRHRSGTYQGRQGCTHNSGGHHHTEGSAGKQSISLSRLLIEFLTESSKANAACSLVSLRPSTETLLQKQRAWWEVSRAVLGLNTSALKALQQADGALRL